jgi:hypothetical protein
VASEPFAWTHEKTRVEFDGRELFINDRRLPLDQIDRLSRMLSRSTAQGSWNRLDCQVHFLAHGKESAVRFHGNAATEEWGPWRPLWDQLDELIRREIEPRLLDRTVRQVAETGSAEIGGGRANGRGRFTVTAEGLQARRMFSKPIAWKSIIAMSGGDVEIVTAGPDGRQRKQNLGLLGMEWDAWQFPVLWQHYSR